VPRRAWLGERDSAPPASAPINFGALRVDREAHRVWIAEQEIELTPLEFKLLVTLFDRKNRVQSRSALLRTSLPREGLPASAAARATHAVTLCALTPNSRDSSAGVRPAMCSSTICCLNASGYGGLVSGISDSFLLDGKVSAKTGQLQKDICTPTTGIQVSMR